MKLTALDLLVTPCDEEEDNLALLTCHDESGGSLLVIRYPDEDEVEITFGDNDPYWLRDLQITLSEDSLLIEVAAQDAEVFNGSQVLEISHGTEADALPEVLETLVNLLRDTGTLVNRLQVITPKS